MYICMAEKSSTHVVSNEAATCVVSFQNSPNTINLFKAISDNVN